MIYCTSSYQNEIIRNKVQQIRFHIQSINIALEYAENHRDKKIILEIDNLKKLPVNLTLEKMKVILQENENLYYDFYTLEDLILAAKILPEKRFMFHFPVTTWALVNILTYYKVSDITLGEPLVFQRKKVIRNLKNQFPDITIRVRPTMGKANILSEMKEDSGITHNWILPQYTDLYDYIDVFDLLDANITREETIVNMYLDKKEYGASLSLLITNNTSPMSGKFVDENWVTQRMDCGQICLEHKFNCHYCETREALYKCLLEQKAKEKQI